MDPTLSIEVYGIRIPGFGYFVSATIFVLFSALRKAQRRIREYEELLREYEEET